MNEFLSHPLWLFVAIVSATLVWIMADIILHFCFYKHLRNSEYMPTQSIFRFRLWFIDAINARKIGVLWFLHHRHWCVGASAFAILALSFFRAVVTEHSLEFSRAGALVVVAGLISLLLGQQGKRATEKIWNKLELENAVEGENDKAKIRNIASNEAGYAERVAFRISLIITMIGSLTWAYGDQIIACGIFPFFNISDQSNTHCF